MKKQKTTPPLQNIELSEITAFLEQEHRKAEEIIEALRTYNPYTLSDLSGFEPISIWTVLAVISKTSEATKKEADLALKRKQSEKAKKLRVDALQLVILNIVRKDLKITESQLLVELEKCIGMGVISAIEDGQIEWDNKNGLPKDTPVSGLKDRLSRAKKLLNAVIKARLVRKKFIE